jgi:hypothetical protein
VRRTRTATAGGSFSQRRNKGHRGPLGQLFPGVVMSPAHPGGCGTSACCCLPAGRLHFLCPGSALAFILMTSAGSWTVTQPTHSSPLQAGRAGAPRCSLGLLHLGRDPVVFNLGSSIFWGSVMCHQAREAAEGAAADPLSS